MHNDGSLKSGKVTIFHVCCVSSCSPVLVTGQCRDVHTVSSGEPPLLYIPLSALSDDMCGTEGESGESHR